MGPLCATRECDTLVSSLHCSNWEPRRPGRSLNALYSALCPRGAYARRCPDPIYDLRYQLPADCCRRAWYNQPPAPPPVQHHEDPGNLSSCSLAQYLPIWIPPPLTPAHRASYGSPSSILLWVENRGRAESASRQGFSVVCHLGAHIHPSSGLYSLVSTYTSFERAGDPFHAGPGWHGYRRRPSKRAGSTGHGPGKYALIRVLTRDSKAKQKPQTHQTQQACCPPPTHNTTATRYSRRQDPRPRLPLRVFADHGLPSRRGP